MPRSTLLFLVAFIIAVPALIWLGSRANQRLDRFSNRWAYASPALLGRWDGEGQAGNTELKLSLTLVRDEVDWYPASQSNPADDNRGVHGTGSLIEPNGVVHPYTCTGRVEDAAGHHTHLKLIRPPGATPGLHASDLSLIWDGGGHLDALAHLERLLPGGSILFSSKNVATLHPALFHLHH